MAGKKLRIVQKYGGTSVADIARLENVALRVKKDVDAGHQIAVVVSAMAGVTNQLVNYTKAFSNVSMTPEHDAIISTGEQITTGLLALALQQLGLKSQAFMGWQLPIVTDSIHTNAEIKKINPQKILSCWEAGIVPVIAGFQGINSKKRITTLGRGGSDTTAVAVAAAVGADRCDIYTDVDGVYTADPRLVPNAQKLNQISYNEMLELAAQGAKVLQTRSVETALKHQVLVRVLSSFNNEPGTDVNGKTAHEKNTRISGITHSADWVLIHLETERFSASLVKSLRETIKKANIHTDSLSVLMLDSSTRISFLVPKADFAKTIQSLEKDKFYPCYKNLNVDPGYAKLSVIGLNLLGKIGITPSILNIAKHFNFPSCLIHTSPSRVSMAIKEEIITNVMRTIHTAFELDRKNESNTTEIMATRL